MAKRPARLRLEAGQTTVEYMLVLSVLVIAMWAAAQLFVPSFQAGLRAMQDDVADDTREGVVGG
ncbi:MAG: hypothetical protein H6741_16760 [Alphaproteobacteria bacterium]|nr:hypothetical protein [Alphaproteobacteria bacterium]MCB9794367.1 hypothetical protein [Alphaproteobacteria bacterium]